MELDRDSSTTITTTAASRNAILVGAYQPGGTDLADFSSAGPTSDGRVKPDVAAPGQAITAPRSKLAETPSCCDCCHEFYTEKQGTSMASPHVAGLVALMFQRNRLQRFDDVKRILIQPSRGHRVRSTAPSRTRPTTCGAQVAPTRSPR